MDGTGACCAAAPAPAATTPPRAAPRNDRLSLTMRESVAPSGIGGQPFLVDPALATRWRSESPTSASDACAAWRRMSRENARTGGRPVTPRGGTVRRGLVAGCGVVAAGWLLVVTARTPLAQGAADLVLLNGRVLTVDATDSVAQAIAIAGGKIVAVGTNDHIRSRVGSRTQVIDLRGRAATPGLIDTHVHFSKAAALYTVDLSDIAIRKMDDVIARVAARVAKTKPGEWGHGEWLGRRQTRRAPLHQRRGSGYGLPQQPGVARADDGALRRGE